MERLKTWVADRLAERNTVVGLVSGGAVAGAWSLKPEIVDFVATIAALIGSALHIVTPEPKKEDPHV
jgi:hypothetical protein